MGVLALLLSHYITVGKEYLTNLNILLDA